MKKLIKTQNYLTLIADLASLIEQGRKASVRYVNTVLVATYWLVGRRVVEYEQKGKERAEYGELLLEQLSRDITSKFGKGFGRENLRLMRQFYLIYKDTRISQTVSGKLSKNKKEQMLSTELLPAPEVLKAEIEHERQRLLEMKIIKGKK
ncbi:MAG: DUF1016 N-terminal domain-containing protein [candidate division Zixibacteria bacterium]|nr:DUF1016 N-terminal domain-containing protein [candidate division Zixibacteria bacterium]